MHMYTYKDVSNDNQFLLFSGKRASSVVTMSFCAGCTGYQELQVNEHVHVHVNAHAI